MKVTKEKLKELKQIDRIEYLLEKNSLKERYQLGSLFYMIKISCFILVAILVLALLVRLNYGEEVFKNFLYSFSDLGIVIGFLLFCGFIADILMIWLGIKKEDELNNEFFNFKVTPKRK